MGDWFQEIIVILLFPGTALFLTVLGLIKVHDRLSRYAEETARRAGIGVGGAMILIALFLEYFGSSILVTLGLSMVPATLLSIGIITAVIGVIGNHRLLKSVPAGAGIGILLWSVTWSIIAAVTMPSDPLSGVAISLLIPLCFPLGMVLARTDEYHESETFLGILGIMVLAVVVAMSEFVPFVSLRAVVLIPTSIGVVVAVMILGTPLTALGLIQSRDTG